MMIKYIFILFFYSSLLTSSINKGKEYFNSGDFANAQKVFQQLIDDNDENAEAYYWLGRTFFRLRNFEEASDHLEEAIDLDENNADYHFWYGNSVGNEIQSANVISQAMMAGDILEAYEMAIKIDPEHIGAHIGAAQFYLQAPGIAGGDIEKAKEEVKILRKLGSKDGDLINIGILIQEEKYVEAEKEYDSFHNNFVDSTDNPQFYNGFGYFLIRQKKFDRAITMFKRQVELRPQWANCHDSLGDGYRAAGKLREALVSYEKAVKIDPNFEASIKNIEEIKKEMARK